MYRSRGGSVYEVQVMADPAGFMTGTVKIEASGIRVQGLGYGI